MHIGTTTLGHVGFSAALTSEARGKFSHQITGFDLTRQITGDPQRVRAIFSPSTADNKITALPNLFLH